MGIITDPRFGKYVGIVIAVVLFVLGALGVQVDVPVVDPVFPVR